MALDAHNLGVRFLLKDYFFQMLGVRTIHMCALYMILYGIKCIYFVGCFNIQKVTPAANGESAKVKVKVRVNNHGIFSIMSATQTEQLEEDGKEEENMDVDTDKKADNPPPAEAQVNGEVPPQSGEVRL